MPGVAEDTVRVSPTAPSTARTSRAKPCEPAPRAARHILSPLNLLRVLHLLHLLVFACPPSGVRCGQVPVMVEYKVCVSPTAPPTAHTLRTEPPEPTSHAVRHILNLLNLLCILHLLHLLFFAYPPPGGWARDGGRHGAVLQRARRTAGALHQVVPRGTRPRRPQHTPWGFPR